MSEQPYHYKMRNNNPGKKPQDGEVAAIFREALNLVNENNSYNNDQAPKKEISDISQINEEHSYVEDNCNQLRQISSSHDDDEQTIVEMDGIGFEEKKPVPDIQKEQPRFAISHTLKKKNLDNSMEDYFFFEVVDEKGCTEFRALTHAFIKKKLFSKVNKLFEYIKRELSGIIEKATDKISTEPDLIQQIIQQYENPPVKKKGACSALFSCCSKPKKRENLKKDHNMRNLSPEIDNELIDRINNISDNISEENADTFFNNEACKIEIEQASLDKTNLLFQRNNTEEKLKDEVDKYSELFNIKKIIGRQEEKIKMQKKTLDNLEDAKSLNECIICMDNERNVIFFPCMHLICCERCGLSKIGSECPECHRKIENRQITN